MAGNSNISGGLIAKGTIYALVMSSPTLRGATTMSSTTVNATNMNATTMKATTKLSAAAYNIRTRFIKNTDARASNACAGLDIGDVILSQPGYVRFSNNVSRATCGTVATVRVKTTDVASITGVVSNSMIFIAWAKY